MDVLNPPLEEIDGIMYRVNPVDHLVSSFNAEITPYHEKGGVNEDDELESMNDVIDDDENELDIQILPNKKYGIKFHVPKLMHSSLIGHKGSTRERLQMDTNSYINIPRRYEEGPIFVTGSTRRSVVKAYRRIQMLVAATRARQAFTHFISLPVNLPYFQEKVLHLKAEVLERCGSDRGVEDGLFQEPKKFHLTFCILVLADNQERQNAIKMLEECKESVIDPITGGRPMKIRVQGLECMNDDPSEVSVLYAKVFSENDVLQQLADKVTNYFNKSGLTIRQRDTVKLHITIMNTYFVSKTDPKSKSRNQMTFDARAILENFGDYNFGEFEVNCIHLSQNHTTADDGYYLPSAKIYFS